MHPRRPRSAPSASTAPVASCGPISSLSRSNAMAPDMMIEVREVERTYAMPGGQSYPALRGLTLTIARGEYVAVLGKSGSGKSTLLNLVAGLDRPTRGSVHVAGEDLSRLSENALAAWRGTHLGVVFQFFQLLPTLTVSENLMLAMELVC